MSKSEGCVVKLVSSELTDEEFVDGLISGNERVSREFYRCFGKRVNRWVWRLLGADAEHEDVVQKVFIAILSSIHSLKKKNSLGSWVDSVTMRVVRNELRSRKYRRQVIFSTDHAEMAVDNSNPAKQKITSRFYEVLNQLNVDDRSIIVLRFMEECTIDEIASAINCSRSTVKRRLARANKRFEKLAMSDCILSSVLKEFDHGN